MALKRDFTDGNIRSQLISFSLPLLFATFLQVFYNAVDMFFVGKFGGTAALAAVSIGGPVMNLCIMTITGLSTGVGIVLASHFGAGDTARVKRCANTAIMLYIALGLALGAAGYILTPKIIRLMQTPSAAFEGACDYLGTVFLGLVFMFGYNLISAFQRAFGDSRTPLYFVACSTVVNIVLDYVFIGPMAMGPFGAALATVIAQAFALAAGIAYFRAKKHIITFSPAEFGIDSSELGLVLRMGIPAAAQQVLINLANTIMTGLANGFGLEAAAGYGIAIKIIAFMYMPGTATGEAISIFASQNVGAGKLDRAEDGFRESIRISLVEAVFVGLLLFFFSPQFSAIFSDDPAVIDFSVRYLIVYIPGLVMLTPVYSQTAFVRGTGNSMLAMIAAVICQLLSRIPISLILTPIIGFTGIAWAANCSPFLALIWYGIIIRSGYWKKSKLAREGAKAAGTRSSAGDGSSGL